MFAVVTKRIAEKKGEKNSKRACCHSIKAAEGTAEEPSAPRFRTEEIRNRFCVDFYTHRKPETPFQQKSIIS